MRELSVFVDESGDFGEYDYHSPYYIITLVFHNQDNQIGDQVSKLEQELEYLGLGKSHCIHTGPIIRREEEYSLLPVEERKRILNKIVAFSRQLDVKYRSFIIEKKEVEDAVEAVGRLSRQIATFIKDKYEELLSYDVVKVYYDNGQVEVSKIVSSTFNALLQNVEFRKVLPSEYKLFQVADMLCTFELINNKLEKGNLSKSDKHFFGDERCLKKNYLSKISKLRYE